MLNFKLDGENLQAVTRVVCSNNTYGCQSRLFPTGGRERFVGAVLALLFNSSNPLLLTLCYFGR